MVIRQWINHYAGCCGFLLFCRGLLLNKRSLHVAKDTCAYTLLKECGPCDLNNHWMRSEWWDLKCIVNASCGFSHMYLELSNWDGITQDACWYQVWTSISCFFQIIKREDNKAQDSMHTSVFSCSFHLYTCAFTLHSWKLDYRKCINVWPVTLCIHSNILCLCLLISPILFILK